MTTENELAAAWNQYNARMILATTKPKDVLCIVGHALRLLADIQAVEGKPLLPLLAAVRDAARKTLATELGYKGALDGSAEMNLWLHKQVMNKLAENGGKVPAELRG